MMWSVAKPAVMGVSGDPKGHHLIQRNYHHHTMFGLNNIDQSKRFPDFINRANPVANFCSNIVTRNFTTAVNLEKNITMEQPEDNNITIKKEAKIIKTINDIPQKKKKKKRRRRKNKKNQKKVAPDDSESGHRRQRQISTISEDSFIICFDDGDSQDEIDSRDSCDSLNLVPSKKVRFAQDSSLCCIHPMVKWSYAYQAARKGPWEECARDRERFRLRVHRTDRILKDVLDEQHRAKIYRERFA